MAIVHTDRKFYRAQSNHIRSNRQCRFFLRVLRSSSLLCWPILFRRVAVHVSQRTENVFYRDIGSWKTARRVGMLYFSYPYIFSVFQLTHWSLGCEKSVHTLLIQSDYCVKCFRRNWLSRKFSILNTYAKNLPIYIHTSLLIAFHSSWNTVPFPLERNRKRTSKWNLKSETTVRMWFAVFFLSSRNPQTSLPVLGITH